MNSGDLSLFTVVVGVRGSGKTLLITYLQQCALRRAAQIKLLRQALNKPKYLYKRKTEVFSNYPLNYYLQPKPLEMEKLIMQTPEYTNCEIYVDEIGGEADRQDWNNPKSKFLNFGIQVMRHKNISFTSTIQSFDWLNARMQWQTDVIIKCRDLAFTPWGRSCNLSQGEVISTIWIDKSGVMTGYSYDETHRAYSLKFMGKRVWGSYDTTHDVDIMGMNAKYEIERQVKRVDSHGNVVNIEKAAKDDSLIAEIVNNTIGYFKYSRPGERVSTSECLDMVIHEGKKQNIIRDNLTPQEEMAFRQEWGKYFKSIGAKVKTYSGRQRYDFEEVQVT